MKKTLIICPHYPVPVNNGSNMRTMSFIRFFKKKGTIDIAYSIQTAERKHDDSIFDNEYLLKGKYRPVSLKRKIVRGLITGVPVPVRSLPKELQRRLLAIIKDNEYDYILVRYVHNCKCLFQLPAKYKQRIIVDIDDILSGTLYDSKFDSNKSLLAKIAHYINRKNLIRYEKKCLDFGTVLFCSNRDRQLLVDIQQSYNAEVAPNIFSDKSFNNHNFRNGFTNRNILLFVGTLNYRANHEGLIWFINKIFPPFKSKYSDGKLLVVGRAPGSVLIDICNNTEGVELYRDVSDVKEYYTRCRAVVVPLLKGSGTRIKILEASLAERPIISTPKGAEGLDLKDRRELLLFESAKDFLTSYGKLIKKENYDALSQRAKQKVKRRYSQSHFYDTMEKVTRAIDRTD